MHRRLDVDLFCEDAGHESFARALVRRLAMETGTPLPNVHPRSVRGGHGRAVTELKLWQRASRASSGRADLLLVMIDANGEGWNEQRRLVGAAIDSAAFPHCIVGCPDPHIEAWCAADLVALRAFTGVEPPAPPLRPGHQGYKNWLRGALEDAGVVVLNDPMDIAPELVERMDLFQAGKHSPSFGHLVRELLAFFAQHAGR